MQKPSASRRAEETHPPHDAGHTYWPEIDGLRAIAILLVVLFHAGLPGLMGGFVGVDVFFVISGFLITGLLAREAETTGRIDLMDFYARRVRRLLPALALVLVTTTILGFWLLSPAGEQQTLGKSTIAASWFVANFYFWRSQSGYFAGASEDLPLLHLWTLAVEEQFYIVWPLLVIAIVWFFGRARFRKMALLSLAVGGLVSFAACVWFTPLRQTMTFYMVPFRGWEFTIGALLAIYPMRSLAAGWVSPALIVAGAAAIVAAGFLFNGAMLFPGFAALVPVLGTGAMIAGLQMAPRGGQRSLPAALLASRPMVTVGKLSYSWYLWHWPLLAFAHLNTAERSIPLNLALAALGLLLAWVTFVGIEEPVRRRKPGTFAHATGSVVTGVALLIATSLMGAGIWWIGSRALQSEPRFAAAVRAMNRTDEMHPECSNFKIPFAGLSPAERCTMGKVGGPVRVVLWGDSHAIHFVQAFARASELLETTVIPRTSGGCRPYVAEVGGAVVPSQKLAAEACVAFNGAVRAELADLAKRGVSTVALAARWSQLSPLPQSAGTWEQALLRTIQTVRSHGMNVVIVAEVPSFPHLVPKCVGRRAPETCGLPRATATAARTASIDVLNRMARDVDGVSVFDPVPSLCSASQCPVYVDGVVLYSDDNHISLEASRRLAGPLAEFLKTHKKR